MIHLYIISNKTIQIIRITIQKIIELIRIQRIRIRQVCDNLIMSKMHFSCVIIYCYFWNKTIQNSSFLDFFRKSNYASQYEKIKIRDILSIHANNVSEFENIRIVFKSYDQYKFILHTTNIIIISNVRYLG